MSRGIIYITKTSCEVYVPTLANIVGVPFSPTAVRDMDVLNEDELATALKSALATNKISPPVTFSLILAKNVLFEKEFTKGAAVASQSKNEAGKEPPPSADKATVAAEQPNVDESKTASLPPTPPVTPAEKAADQKQQIQSFLEHVPFEEVESVTITKPTATTIVATNKELYTCIEEIVTKAGFIVDSVLPDIVFPSLTDEKGLTVANAQQLLSQVDSNKQYNLLKIAATFSPQDANTGKKAGKEKSSNMRVIILASVFGVLLIFMVVLYYVMYMMPQPKSKALQSVAPTPLPPLAVSPTVAISSGSASLSNLKVQLMISSSTASYAAEVKKTLATDGVTSVETIPTNTSSNKTFVVFSSDISQAAKTALTSDLQQDFPSISAQDSTSTSQTVVITLGGK